nr:hypothetical protein [Tanacetum cinerariifolium]
LRGKVTQGKYVKLSMIRRGDDLCVDFNWKLRVLPVDVRLHQGSAISSYLYALILDELSMGIQENSPWLAIRPAMLNESECWLLMKVQANRIEVAEMRMLRWTW